MGVLVQIVLAAAILRVPGIKELFEGLGWFVNQVIQKIGGGGSTSSSARRCGDETQPWGFIFAVKVLPIIIFFSALMSALYYVGFMQRVVAALAWALRKTLRVTGAEATCMGAGIFRRPDGGAADDSPADREHDAGAAHAHHGQRFPPTSRDRYWAPYVMMLGGQDEAARTLFAKHLIAASVISAPAAFVMARILLPETETPPAEDPPQPLGRQRRRSCQPVRCDRRRCDDRHEAGPRISRLC